MKLFVMVLLPQIYMQPPIFLLEAPERDPCCQVEIGILSVRRNVIDFICSWLNHCKRSDAKWCPTAIPIYLGVLADDQVDIYET